MANGALYLAGRLNASSMPRNTFLVTQHDAASGVLLNSTSVTLDVVRDESPIAPRFNASVFTLHLNEAAAAG